jgi:predicted glycosyltransferase
MRILCHAQSLSGVGHFVRMHAIASGLCAGHEVHLVDGGRPVPTEPGEAAPARLPLPRLARVDGRVCADGSAGDASARAVFVARTRALTEAVERIAPDVVLVDHHPFGKWELTGEIEALAAAARRRRPGARVICSLRDVAPPGRFESAAPAAFEAGVLARLAASFDELWIHGDPAFARIEDHFERAAELPVPVRYTGFVSPAPAAPRAPQPLAVLSCGGGAGSLPFLLAAIAAFRRLHDAGALGAIAGLEVFAGAFAAPAELDALRAATREGPMALRPFSTDFPARLAASALSISRAGYNTSALLLRARIPAVLVPDPRMSDQPPRARRLAELGLASRVEGDPPPAASIADAIEAALARPARAHGFDLDGVAATRQLVECVAATRQLVAGVAGTRAIVEGACR